MLSGAFKYALINAERTNPRSSTMLTQAPQGVESLCIKGQCQRILKSAQCLRGYSSKQYGSVHGANCLYAVASPVTQQHQHAPSQGLQLTAGEAPRLRAVEPEAAEAVEDLGLHEADPARVQLHDDCEGRVGGQDDVVDHGRVVAHPHVVGPRHRPGPVIPAPPAGKLAC